MIKKICSLLVLTLICGLGVFAFSACSQNSDGSGVCADSVHDFGEFVVQVVYYKGTAQELEANPQVKGGLWRCTIYYYSETEPDVNENGEYVGNFWYYDSKNSIVEWKK